MISLDKLKEEVLFTDSDKKSHLGYWEGYISALADNNLVSVDVYNKFLDWITKKFVKGDKT